jgi:hypothetical protein
MSSMKRRIIFALLLTLIAGSVLGLRLHADDKIKEGFATTTAGVRIHYLQSGDASSSSALVLNGWQPRQATAEANSRIDENFNARLIFSTRRERRANDVLSITRMNLKDISPAYQLRHNGAPRAYVTAEARGPRGQV